MNRSNKKNLVSPIVGRCSVLCSEIIRCTAHTPNTVKHPFVDELKKDSAILFKYALRQLRGQDYYKRTVDLVEEINAQLYLLRNLNGIKDKDVVILDCLCEEILQQLNSIRFGQNAETKG